VTDLVVASESGGTFLYAVTAGAATTLLSFRINPANGVLSPIQAINSPSGFGEPRLAVHPSGKYLYAAQVTNCVLAYSIDPATGNLTQASCSVQNPNGPLVVAPSGKFAYGGDSNSSSSPILLTAYSVNQSDGSLTSFQSVVTDEANSLLYTDPQGHALYNLTTPPQGLGCGGLSIWEIDATSGQLSSLNPSAGGPCTPWSMSFDPGSQFVYLAINIYHPFDGVYGAAVDPTNGNLTFVSGPSATQSSPRWAVAEPSQGRFLFVYNPYGIGPSYTPAPAIVAYATDPSTAAISQPGQTAPLPLADSVRMVIVAPWH
jgi:6-phosphogluconolactonase (cycloisomerase 2 family)